MFSVAAHNFLKAAVEHKDIDVSEALVDSSGKLRRAISPTAISPTSSSPKEGDEKEQSSSAVHRKKKPKKKHRKKGYIKIAKQIEHQRKVELAVNFHQVFLFVFFVIFIFLGC